MSDDFWSSQTLRVILIGMSGGFAGAISARTFSLWELFRHVTVGGIAAIMVGPYATVYFGTALVPTVWFTGVVGVIVCQGAIHVVKRWFGISSKRVKND
jgi:hypothetical protein